LEIEFTIPYPPTVNNYKRRGATRYTKTGKTYQSLVNTDATNRFYYETWVKIRSLNAVGFAGATISVTLGVCPPDGRKRDLDNVVKPTLDALQRGGLFTDDYQIARLVVERKAIIKPYGQIIVRITSL
jgi:crossover junction endodeoxyribonuclease RusA